MEPACCLCGNIRFQARLKSTPGTGLGLLPPSSSTQEHERFFASATEAAELTAFTPRLLPLESTRPVDFEGATWIVHRCLNCMVDIYAKNQVQTLVNVSACKIGSTAVNSVALDPRYSPVLQVIVTETPTRTTSSSASNLQGSFENNPLAFPAPSLADAEGDPVLREALSSLADTLLRETEQKTLDAIESFRQKKMAELHAYQIQTQGDINMLMARAKRDMRRLGLPPDADEIEDDNEADGDREETGLSKASSGGGSMSVSLSSSVTEGLALPSGHFKAEPGGGDSEEEDDDEEEDMFDFEAGSEEVSLPPRHRAKTVSFAPQSLNDPMLGSVGPSSGRPRASAMVNGGSSEDDGGAVSDLGLAKSLPISIPAPQSARTQATRPGSDEPEQDKREGMTGEELAASIREMSLRDQARSLLEPHLFEPNSPDDF